MSARPWVGSSRVREVAEMQEEGGAQLQPTTFGRLPTTAHPSLLPLKSEGVFWASLSSQESRHPGTIRCPPRMWSCPRGTPGARPATPHDHDGSLQGQSLPTRDGTAQRHHSAAELSNPHTALLCDFL